MRLLFFFHGFIDGIIDKAVHTLPMSFGKILYCLPFAFLYEKVNSIVGFLVVPLGCLFLCVAVCHIATSPYRCAHYIYNYIYTPGSIK